MSYSSIVLADSPISYWQLNETTLSSAVDSGTGGNTGTYTGGLSLNSPSAAGLGTCVSLHGSGGFVDCGSAGNLNLASGFSLEAWIKTTNAGSGTGIMSHGTGGWYVRVVSGFISFIQSQTANIVSGNTYVSNNVWHYIVVTVDSSRNIILYVDGKLDQQTTTSVVFSTTQNFMIGCDTSSTGQTEFFNGSIDEVAVYGSVLSATQVKNHWNIPAASSGTAAILLAGF